MYLYNRTKKSIGALGPIVIGVKLMIIMGVAMANRGDRGGGRRIPMII